MDSSAVSIYVVDDDPGHTRLIQKNLRRCGILNNIKVFPGGAEVLEELHGNDGAVPPVLVLLDLNMPGVDGLEVLKAIKSNEKTRQIPVIVLTTSNVQTEIEKCYELGCNLFISKPMAYPQFAENIQKLGLVFQIVEAPRNTTVK